MSTPNTVRNYKPLIWALAISINAIVALAFIIPDLEILKRFDFSILPTANAVLNSLTFVSLLMALYHIKNKNIALHKTFIFAAFLFTSIFLLSYLLYHFSTPSTTITAKAICEMRIKK